MSWEGGGGGEEIGRKRVGRGRMKGLKQSGRENVCLEVCIAKRLTYLLYPGNSALPVVERACCDQEAHQPAEQEFRGAG